MVPVQRGNRCDRGRVSAVSRGSTRPASAIAWLHAWFPGSSLASSLEERAVDVVQSTIAVFKSGIELQRDQFLRRTAANAKGEVRSILIATSLWPLTAPPRFAALAARSR